MVIPGRRDLALLAVLATAVVIALIAFGSALIDDAYITFGAARQLADGNLANYNGDPIEQSSSPLHVVALAAVHRLTGVSLPIVGFVLGLVFAVGAVAATWVLGVRTRLSSERATLAAAVVATSLPLTYWAIGGLETPMVTMLVVIAVAALSDLTSVGSRVVAIAALCLYSAARPEAFIVALLGLALTTVLLMRRGRAAHLIAVWAALLAFVGVQFALRWSITGHLLPNTALAKARGLDITRGVKYLATTLDRVSSVALALLLVAAVVGAVAGWRTRDERRLIVAAWALLGLGVALGAGGDWMAGGRFLAPWFPLFAVLACATSICVRWAVPTAVVLQLVGTAVFVQSDSTGSLAGSSITSPGQRPIPLVESRSVGVRRDLQTVPALVEIVRELNSETGRTVRVSSGQAGVSIFYLFGSDGVDVVFIDRFQLSTNDFDGCEDLLDRSVYGSAMSYSAWLANEDRCGVAPPDVIFEVGTFSEFPELAERYTVVFQQTDSDLTIEPAWASGPWRHAQFIAVSNELL